MATTPEGRVKKAVKEYLKSIGAWFYMPVQNGMGVVGIPDLICCVQGTFVAIETKAPGKVGNTTANQDRQLEGIQKAGGVSLVVDSVETVRKYFEAHGLA